MGMKKAWEILKRVDISNAEEYERASLEDRKKWHGSQYSAYSKRLEVLRRNTSVDLTDVEHVLYQEMKQYQNMRAFHGRQSKRLFVCLRRGDTECDDYYSLELEGPNRKHSKLFTTPTGKLDPYVELSLEGYNQLSPKQKERYHQGMSLTIKRKNEDLKESDFHMRMYSRLRNKNNLPTFPASKYGGGNAQYLGETTKEEYLNLSDGDKRKYHSRMSNRHSNRRGKKFDGVNRIREVYLFHTKMSDRLRHNSSLPTFYSLEHEQEEQ